MKCNYCILAPPVVTNAPLNTYVITLDTVTLWCGFDSTLPVNITWTKEELPSQGIVTVVMDERITISDDNNTGELIIYNATSVDSGLYICTGVTIAGTAITAADVVVGSKSFMCTGYKLTTYIITTNKFIAITMIVFKG